MISRLSLRLRLAFGLTTAMVLVWMLAMLASGFTLKHEVEELSESLLALTAERLLPLALDSLAAQQADQFRRFERGNPAADNAAISAHAPGTGTTLIPAARA